MATVAQAAQEPAPRTIMDSRDVADDSSSQRSCRDLLSTAAGWYSVAKDYVPDVAKSAVSKLEVKVGEKLSQYPETVQRVEAFMDKRVIPAAEVAAAKTQEVLANEQVQAHVVGPSRAAVARVVEKTSALLATERGQAFRAKATGAVQAVNERASAIRASAAQRVDQVVEASLDAAGRVHDAAHLAVGFEQTAATFLKEKWRSPPTSSEIHASAVALANMVDALVDRNLPDSTAMPTPDSASETAPEARVEVQDEKCDKTKLSNASVATLARNIAGKVSFRMKKRVVKQLEAAKGHFKLRTERLLHSTNLIQYAKSLGDDERYAKLTTVLTEAASVAQSSRQAAVRTVSATTNAANAGIVSGIELFHRGEATAKLAIVTTGKAKDKCSEYANELAARIRQRIQELEQERKRQAPKTDDDLTDNEAEEKVNDGANATVVTEAIKEYVHLTAMTGSATFFVFRDDLNQVLTYAYTTAKESEGGAQAQATVDAAMERFKPAWTALTQFKDHASTQIEGVKNVAKARIGGVVNQGSRVVQQATTWTNVAVSEFAATTREVVSVARTAKAQAEANASHLALPAGFTAALRFILQRMAQPRNGVCAATEPVADVAEEADGVSNVVVDPVVAPEQEQEHDQEEGVEAELQQVDESEADWYYSTDGIETSDGGEISIVEVEDMVEAE